MNHNKAIICVDDEVIVLVAIVQELKQAFGSRFLYSQASNADLAVRTIDELTSEGTKVIFIISDWLMPGMKGDVFLEIIREKHPEIKAIMITGYADAEAMDNVKKNASVLAVLQKPWDIQELVTIIEKHADTIDREEELE
jgi:DNA-binding NtrC family response regulator